MYAVLMGIFHETEENSYITISLLYDQIVYIFSS
jgi:hypothetical protein